MNKNKMMKWATASLATLMFLGAGMGTSPEVQATGGKLKTSSITTINGVYYGQHGTDNHWHKAKKTANGWYPTDSQATLTRLPSASTSSRQSGWRKSGNYWYYYRSNGTKATGWTKVGGAWYYMNANGVMQTGWLQSGGKWYYLKSGGAMATGWTKVGKTWYYMNTSGVMQTGWQKVSGNWFYLNASGAMATGWRRVGSSWYYMNAYGVMQTGWLELGDYQYYLNLSGAMATGWVSVDPVGNEWYYMGTSGDVEFGPIEIGDGTYPAPHPEFPGVSAATIEKNRRPLVEEMRSAIDVELIYETFTRLVNEERLRNGIPAVEYKGDRGYQESADLRAYEIRAHGGLFQHTRPDGTFFRTANEEWTDFNSGENIQYFSELTKFFDEEKIAEKLFTQWKNSPSHYENMMDEAFTHQTLGLYFDVYAERNEFGYTFYYYYFNSSQILTVQN